MEAREVGDSGLFVSAVGLGCNNFGSLLDEQSSKKVINRALELGITFFDTADIYGNSEVILGKALGRRRKDVVVATKFGMSRDEVPGGASRSYVRTAAERSLMRLGTDYIDIFYLHQPDHTVPPGETLLGLNELVRAGKVRYAAASNTKVEFLLESNSATQGWKGFIAAQEHYNLLRRDIEQSLLGLIDKLHMGLVPYFPLASGLLTGKYKRGMAPAGGTRLGSWKQLAAGLLTDRNFDKLELLDEFARSRDHSVTELAFAWLLGKSCVCSVIAGATQIVQVEENARAAAWRLTAEEMAEVDVISSQP